MECLDEFVGVICCVQGVEQMCDVLSLILIELFEDEGDGGDCFVLDDLFVFGVCGFVGVLCFVD